MHIALSVFLRVKSRICVYFCHKNFTSSVLRNENSFEIGELSAGSPNSTTETYIGRRLALVNIATKFRRGPSGSLFLQLRTSKFSSWCFVLRHGVRVRFLIEKNTVIGFGPMGIDATLTRNKFSDSLQHLQKCEWLRTTWHTKICYAEPEPPFLLKMGQLFWRPNSFLMGQIPTGLPLGVATGGMEVFLMAP